MAQDMKELGRKGGLANGRKKFAEIDRAIDKVFSHKFSIDEDLGQIMADFGGQEGDKEKGLDVLIQVLFSLAARGNLGAMKLLFDLRGVTPEARERLAKATAALKMVESPEGVKLGEIAPVTPDQMRAEAVALGIYP